MIKPSPTQIKILENAAGQQPAHYPKGRSQCGGWSVALASCFRHGWLSPHQGITEAGRAALTAATGQKGGAA